MSENNNDHTPEDLKKETEIEDISENTSAMEEMKESDVENTGDRDSEDPDPEDVSGEESGSRFQEYFIEKTKALFLK
ncbi:MAG: hypothetical protein R2942_15590 [Ignavibacteria bacterium]